MFESRTYYYREPNKTVEHATRQARLQWMIDDCLGGERSKKLLPDLRRELAAEQGKKESEEMQALRERAAAECQRADNYRRCYEDSLKVKPVVEYRTPPPVFGDAACFLVGLVVAAVLTSLVWSFAVFT